VGSASAVDVEKVTPVPEPKPAFQSDAFRVRAVMKQGTAASLPGVWERYSTDTAARAAARDLYRDDRVMRAYIVTDTVPSRFVEWVER
jgi:hypothetical protein